MLIHAEYVRKVYVNLIQRLIDAKKDMSLIYNNQLMCQVFK